MGGAQYIEAGTEFSDSAVNVIFDFSEKKGGKHLLLRILFILEWYDFNLINLIMTITILSRSGKLE